MGWILLIAVFFFDIKEVISEPVTVSMPVTDMPEQETRQIETQKIYIDGLNKSFVNHKPVENLDVLLSMIKNLELGDPVSTVVVAQFHKDAKHKVFVQVTDSLDEAGYEKRIEILMSEKAK